MEDTKLIIMFSIITLIAITYIFFRMSLIYKEVQLNRLEEIKNDFQQIYDSYLMMCKEKGEKAIENPSFKEMVSYKIRTTKEIKNELQDNKQRLQNINDQIEANNKRIQVLKSNIK